MKTSKFSPSSLGLGLICLAFILAGCSAEKKTLVSKSYHNLTAHFNAYFLANERMKEIEAAYWQNHEDNYYNILRVFPKVDTVTASGLQEPLEDCIKKASIAIQNHKNSKWVDDSYVLVGKARYYSADFVNAIETFKFVNINSENDDDTRHEALVFLMRTFIDYNEQNNAIAVSDYLRKEKLNKENLKSLYLTRAYLYQQREDFNNMVKNLALAAPLLEKKDHPARYHFIIGQVFQQLGFESLAYENYDKTLKNNPAYELSFYARLNMAQVFELADEKDVEKNRKYFRNLLKDAKNKEFQDKIYYEMAEFEKEQGNQEIAIEYYKESAKASTNNKRQQSYAFHRLGQIYYEESKQYELAKAYYDSTIAVMPTDEPEYESIRKRQEILADFVLQINTIALQDSLLQLAAMDSSVLIAMAEEQFLVEQQLAMEQERTARRSASFTNAQDNPFAQRNNSNTNSASGGTWYFYNPASISTGRANFIRKWGDRPLVDNWRRREALRGAQRNAIASAEAENAEDSEEEVMDQQEQQDAFREAFLSRIPFSASAKTEANTQIEEAYYLLGKIYNFNLEEKENAQETFQKLLNRYPESSYTAEVLYFLYIIGNELEDGKGETYKNRLLAEFPNSTYSKTIVNPNYRQESEALSAALKATYATAFDLYKQQDYKAADSILQTAIHSNPPNDFTDNLTLLRILIMGRTEPLSIYQFSLQEFIEKYPDSELIAYAQNLLQTSRGFETSLLREQGTESFIRDFDQEHFFVIIFSKASGLADILPQKLDTFSSSKFQALALKSANMNLDDEKAMIMVNEFRNKEDAQGYLQTYQTEADVKNEISDNKVQEFIITKDNFQILYKTKDISSYVSFYEKHY